MRVEPCSHEKDGYDDVVLAVKIQAGKPVQFEAERAGLQKSLQQKGFDAQVSAQGEDSRQGVLEVRVCKPADQITQEAIRGMEAVIRGQGGQVLQN
ncbi:MAG: hypothetical protein PHX87_04580 [Candidatus Peribacteraceae bacterium]|nr:hypothetical protein [Candidatus Peribacteraceae bacterium]MDD5742673.1 hypothetical protein [Candidatus Peribacteraceae bacterium]